MRWGGRGRIVHSLQAQFLVALVLIGLLPLGLVGFGVAMLDRRAITAQSARSLTEAARGLAGQVENALTGVSSASQAIAALPMMTRMDTASQETLLRELFHHYYVFARLSIFDGTGNRVAASHPGPAVSIAASTSFQIAWRYGQQAWEVAPAPSTGRLALLIRTPMRNEARQVVSVLGTVVDLESCATLIIQAQNAGDSRAFILDARGKVLIHPESGAIQEHRDYSWLGVPTGGRPVGHGTVRYTLDRVVRIAGYAPVPTMNWTAVVERPERTVLAPTQHPWQVALTGLALSACLALVAAYSLARTLTRPVRHLAHAARALGAGEPTISLPTIKPEHGELGMLIAAFAAMRDAVAEREAGLRHLAAEKVALAARALASEHRYYELVQDLDAIVWEAEAPICQFSFVSQRAEALLGYPIAQWYTEPDFWVNHLHADDRVRVVSTYRARILTGQDFQCEYRFLAADGRVIWCNDRVRIRPDAAGPGRQVRGIMVDITARKRDEDAIRQLNADLEQRVHERTAELEASNRELEAFAYTVSHDLRTPLRGIDGFSNVLLEDYADRLDAQGQHYLQRVRLASQRMGLLIDALLHLSRVMRSELHRTTVDMSALAQSVVTELQHLHPARQVTCCITPGLQVRADANLLRLVLENLLGNAWKFTSKQANARIELGVEPGTGQHTYRIGDNGAGFNMAYADKLFGAFQRLHTTAEFEGLGIGLATVQRILHRHGGRIWAEGAEGQGATFYFTLPD